MSEGFTQLQTPHEAHTEPFGQLGVRQFVGPAIIVACAIITCFSAMMWYRSFDLADGFERVTVGRQWWVRSIYGRIVLARTDFLPIGDTSATNTDWRYSSVVLPDQIRDGWSPSWRKELGVEWGHQPLISGNFTYGGFWLRIRWRTITLLAGLPPVLTIVRSHRRTALEKSRRGFAIQPTADANQSR